LQRFGICVAVLWTLALIALAMAIGPAPARAGIATWYGAESGHTTSNGERFDPEGACADYPQHSCTCAHRVFPFGTHLTVRWRGRAVVCRVNDRGPDRSTGADIDLSKSAARRLGMVRAGRARVSIERMGRME
jgi:peptidoglycan lytic transglycosylase